tara:strand:+ start:5647 stop:5805 length:159 start_codon:yes stop_codon:yes gene_type:complete
MDNINELVNKLIIKIKDDVVVGNPEDLINLLLNHIPVKYIELYLRKKDNEKV